MLHDLTTVEGRSELVAEIRSDFGNLEGQAELANGEPLFREAMRELVAALRPYLTETL